jgi:hypothetical protein
MVVIGGMHHQHDSSSWQLAWDLKIAVVDRSTIDTDGTAGLRSLKFTLGVCNTMFSLVCKYNYIGQETMENSICVNV